LLTQAAGAESKLVSNENLQLKVADSAFHADEVSEVSIDYLLGGYLSSAVDANVVTQPDQAFASPLLEIDPILGPGPAAIATTLPQADFLPPLQPLKYHQAVNPANVVPLAPTTAPEQQPQLPQQPPLPPQQPPVVLQQQQHTPNQQPQQQLQALVVDASDDDSDMSEDKTVAPPLFRGTAAENGEDWFRHFENYCAYRELTPEKRLALFRVLLTDLAGDWLASLNDDSVATYDAVKQAFDKRYKTPEMIRYRSAKDLFSRKQQKNQSVDDFCVLMQKAARVIGVDERTTVYATLNGINPCYLTYVAQSRPTTMAALLEAARVAELTIQPANTDTGVSDQLSEMKAEVHKLNEKWEKMVVNAAKGEGTEGGATSKTVSFQRSATPPPSRNFQSVSYRPQRFQSVARSFPTRGENAPWRPRAPRPAGTLSPMATPFYGRPQGPAMLYGQSLPHTVRYQASTQPAPTPQWTEQQPLCGKCGRRCHAHPQQCPAINKTCGFCGKYGHFYSVCRKAAGAAQNPAMRNDYA